jgi:ADP-heptose:LPS heptosyltransferase
MFDLTRMFDGVEDVITWESRVPEAALNWDVQVEINELPYIFRTQPEDLPLAIQYLKRPKWLERAVNANAHHPDNLRVGIVWASGEWNPSRSVPAPLLQSLLSTSGAEFWNLQGGASRAQWESFSAGPHRHAAEECTESIVRLAELIAQLDLVITPDTLAAHLAGAMGTSAWVMLEHAADWRWQHRRSDSPWYPSLQLFRQPKPQDWNSVVEAVQSELKQFVASRAKKRLVA